ncbi:conserved hypothetical protein [Capnocytophaga ochracea DSM 7271]|uniref:Lipoprotein n=1 Tax=Capnocytophaga ochracea (strain ATCC 27872 / DSM 7271 / CCUG 9716 / JCM 12966 / NCTC 12371 / SS31 / VPI 2845) TaxID=521097 RepID=C7M849_CAPOD|nr:DUF3261 domain-containing protein [Capnocytophaga ochracea]ACU93309.1 conserved hypothetical protein [Capnocytophaga ochracea DSM 7271]UAK51999.1 DUF3261 domain-containing protein [Capnocytophaga ochracea]
MKQILKCSLFAILLSLSSCSPSYKLPTEYQLVATNKTIITNPHIRVGEEYLYRATITAYGHTFSGLLAAKIAADNTWRVALTTDFGNTLFDFENQKGKIKTNYVIPSLNKKIIIRTLTTDFKHLLKTHWQVTQKYTNGTIEVQQSKDGNDAVYLFTSGTNLFKQLNMQGKKLYTTFTYNTNNITIEHHSFTIKIVLEPLIINH